MSNTQNELNFRFVKLFSISRQLDWFLRAFWEILSFAIKVTIENEEKMGIK